MSAERSVSSGLKAAGNGAISAKPATLMGVAVYTDGTNPGSIILYDEATYAGTGTCLGKFGFSGASYGGSRMNINVKALVGISYIVAGTNCTAEVYFK